MANTVIQLKWSEATATPASLNVAEPAYSNTSGKLFIGQAGNQVIAVGGKYYTDIVDGATDANTASKLVKRDASGNFSAGTITAALSGNATSATQLQTARFFNITGDVATQALSFNGTANVDISVELTNTGVTAGSYGSASAIPTVTVDEDGRVTSVTTNSITTSLSVAADTGVNTVALATETLTFVGGDGITTSITPTDNVRFDVDNTVVRTTGGTISGDLAITGNLVISGTQIVQDVESIRTEDSLIELAANNTVSDTLDIGFFGSANTAGALRYHTFMRDATDGKFKILVDGTEKPNVANAVNVGLYSTGTLVANITGGTVSGLTGAIAIADGGTGKTTAPAAMANLMGYTSTATAAGTTTLTNTSSYYQQFTGSTTQTVQLPVTSTLQTGWTFHIVNNSTGNLTVNSSGANLVYTVPPGTTVMVTCIATAGTTAADWEAGLTDFSTYTGTGNVVMNTSPVLTTPNIGTPSFATLTNATGLPIVGGTTGTLTIARGGTNQTTFTNGIIAFNGTSLATLANTGTAATYANASHIPVITTDAYGRVSAVTNTAIAIAASQITSGTLATARGGTGLSSFTGNGVFYASSTSVVAQASSSTEGHILTINASGVPTFSHLSGGTF